MGIAVARRIAAQQHGVQAVVAGHHQAAVVQRHLDQLALALAFAAEQCRQHGLRGVHAGHQVHHGHAELQRRRVGFAIERHQPGFALDHQVIAGTLGLGAAAVVAGNRAVDQPGLDGLELFVAQAQLLGAAGLEVVDDHVELRQQVVDDLHAFLALQVQRDRPLVAVHAVEVRGLGLADAHAPVARIVAASGVLDLDDFGAEVGQHLAAQRAGEHARQIEYAYPLKREVDALG
ncbi:hypothetical protein D3C81_1191750 [compost metagenome]